MCALKNYHNWPTALFKIGNLSFVRLIWITNWEFLKSTIELHRLLVWAVQSSIKIWLFVFFFIKIYLNITKVCYLWFFAFEYFYCHWICICTQTKLLTNRFSIFWQQIFYLSIIKMAKNCLIVFLQTWIHL